MCHLRTSPLAWLALGGHGRVAAALSGRVWVPMAGRGQARTMPAWMAESAPAPAPAWGPRTPPVVPPDWEGPDPRNKLSGADGAQEPSEADSLPPKRPREPWERSASSQGGVRRGPIEGDETQHWKRSKVSRPEPGSSPSQHSGLASGLADLKNGCDMCTVPLLF